MINKKIKLKRLANRILKRALTYSETKVTDYQGNYNYFHKKFKLYHRLEEGVLIIAKSKCNIHHEKGFSYKYKHNAIWKLVRCLPKKKKRNGAYFRNIFKRSKRI